METPEIKVTRGREIPEDERRGRDGHLWYAEARMWVPLIWKSGTGMTRSEARHAAVQAVRREYAELGEL